MTLQLPLVNILDDQATNIHSKEIVMFVLTAARISIAEKWKTWHDLHLSLWYKKAWNLAISEKITHNM